VYFWFIVPFYIIKMNIIENERPHCAYTSTTDPVPVLWAGHIQRRKILIYFSNKIYVNNFIEEHSETVMA